MTTPVLVITGTVGAGKTSVGYELSTILEHADIRHALVEMDALGAVYPPSVGDPYGRALGLMNLHWFWQHASRIGAERAVILDVVEAETVLDDYRSAIPDAEFSLVRLTAPAAVREARLRARELGSRREWCLERTHELEMILDQARLEHHLVRNDGSVPETARAILRAIGWNP